MPDIVVRKCRLVADGFEYHGSAEPMPLDWQVCSRARLTRDARLDGRFFIAVLDHRNLLPPNLSSEHLQRE